MALKMIAEGEEVMLGNATLVRERAGVYKAKDDSSKIRELTIAGRAIYIIENRTLSLRDKNGREKSLDVEMQVLFNPKTIAVEEVRTPFFNLKFLEKEGSFEGRFVIHKDGNKWRTQFAIDLDGLSNKLRETLSDEIVKSDLGKIMDFNVELMGCD